MTYPLPAQKQFSRQVLAWYDNHARHLPWRSLPGEIPDPYHVWLSEIMLQQTTVATVGPYFSKFLANWPTIKHMAAAPLDDILTAWAGLGYYARARNLHKCANVICRDFGGYFPTDHDELLALPGIGPYTAAAISAIAFDRPETVVDGNIERIMARVFRIEEPLPTAKKDITDKAAQLTPLKRPGDYAQSLMDIGASICTPRNPDCQACPVTANCAAYAARDMERYPVKAPKKAKPVRRAVVFWIENDEGLVLLRRWVEKGLLGGMMEFPSTDWQADDVTLDDASVHFLAASGFPAAKALVEKALVRHTFTHFHLELRPVRVVISGAGNPPIANSVWVQPTEFDGYALPTLMRKVVQAIHAP
ncbi:A/G-specific adenine glycosylase [Sneathiella sp.]|uniref:A/G-specific adenine glycosylase n=1 Tax=Sneathiella sp. TaxID=1964365 RepID=UPI003567CE58